MHGNYLLCAANKITASTHFVQDSERNREKVFTCETQVRLQCIRESSGIVATRKWSGGCVARRRKTWKAVMHATATDLQNSVGKINERDRSQQHKQKPAHRKKTQAHGHTHTPSRSLTRKKEGSTLSFYVSWTATGAWPTYFHWSNG